MPNLKKYSSLQKNCYETNESDEKCHENITEEEEEEIYFLCNEEE